ncbi:hypothetical protein ACHQM5_024989 [Ranunculus cassubicifolius]
MGGGNGNKAKMAREKNLEKQKAANKGSQLEANKKAMSIQCKVCMQTFICTTSEAKCREHAEAKHPKSDVSTCFPHLKQEDVSQQPNVTKQPQPNATKPQPNVTQQSRKL